MSKSRKSSATKKQRISRRVVNTKRHTTGYVVGGKTISVDRARKMASRGQLAGVRVVGDHIQANLGCKPLYDLPTKIEH